MEFAVQSLVQDEEKKGIPSDRIIIGGFSQGGAVALHAALTMNKKIGGLILLSTWLPLHAKIMKLQSELPDEDLSNWLKLPLSLFN
ncbi:hypothetical protein BSL78_28579 [Apostichopus japonicus]|uniref:palmitoyl-protein hydrolase n=1 Tax=Stichopus japonicus TaxID=307972 RepID=A0A2G8JFT2_STIJA|nr:hypothetical protein BSL78_28579 [Apostichopus japonicus]